MFENPPVNVGKCPSTGSGKKKTASNRFGNPSMHVIIKVIEQREDGEWHPLEWADEVYSMRNIFAHWKWKATQGLWGSLHYLANKWYSRKG